MESKNVKKAVITGVATVVGIFGGMKLYANKKKEKRAQNEKSNAKAE